MPTSGNSGCAIATLAGAVDFVTIHILPYWEDFPIPARDAAAHVDAIRKQVVGGFPGKEILIGEVGWPSAGRMREGALPSPANQARVIQDVLARGKRENFRVNVIEAFDQPWKRALEGTVGGHWGLFDDATRAAEIRLGRAGVQPSALALAGGRRHRCSRRWCSRAAIAARGAPARRRLALWLAVAANAVVGGVLIGWTHRECADREPRARRLAALAGASRRSPCWRRSSLSAALLRGTPLPGFRAAARSGRRARPRSARAALGALLIALMRAGGAGRARRWCSIRATAIFRLRR